MTMKPYLIRFLIIIPLFTTVTTTTHRRILHQPLFPVSPPPSPPSSTINNPFFHENPNPPLPPYSATEGVSTTNTTVTHPVAPQPTNKPAKIIAVVISVGIVTLGMLSALAFFIYKKHKSKQESESRKLVGGNSFNERNLAPSNFLYIGTVEPTRTRKTTTTTSESTNMNSNGSPYNKLHSIKRSDRYRPSPELQPLPPLKKLQLQPVNTEFVNSPFSDEEEEEEQEMNDFYTPQGSIDSYNSKRNYTKNSSSKRTSPRSRLSVSSSPDEKQQPPPRLAKFAAPPPGPDMTRLQHKPKIPVPPPQQPKTEPIIPKIVKTMSFPDVDASKPKLKPLHWDKVRATSDRDTVWDHLKSSSFQLNEDVMESLFGCNSGGGSAKKQDNGKSVVPPTEKRVLDPNKSQNIAILLRALNVTQEEVSRGILQGNQDCLDAQLLEILVKMAPTKEEEIKLKDYRGDISKLGSAERFLKAILDIPFAFTRVEAMLYRANFENEVKYLRSSFQSLEAASEELKKSRLFFKLLEAILRAGNRMNVGTNRGEATAFKLDTLLKLVDIKGTDGKTTLLHFVVQEIIRSEGTEMPCVTKIETNPVFNEGTFKKQGLQVLSGLSRELSHVTKAAGMDSDVLSGYVTKLEMGLQKIQSEVDDTREIQGNFFGSMRVFIKEAEIELVKIKISEKQALVSVKDVTEYFHGDTMKEGVYPFRIFMIVRDFLGILEHVCKEVGQMQNRILVGTATSFRVPSSAPLPAVTKYSMRNSSSSSDEESSYSSPRER